MQLTCMCVLADYGISEWKNGRNIISVLHLRALFACCGDEWDAEVIEDNLHLGNGETSKLQQKCSNLM